MFEPDLAVADPCLDLVQARVGPDLDVLALNTVIRPEGCIRCDRGATIGRTGDATSQQDLFLIGLIIEVVWVLSRPTQAIHSECIWHSGITASLNTRGSYV